MSRSPIFVKATREKLVDLWNERCPEILGTLDNDGEHYLRQLLGDMIVGRSFTVATAAGDLDFSMNVTGSCISVNRRFIGSREASANARMMREADRILGVVQGFHAPVGRSGKSNVHLFADKADNANIETALRWLTHQIDTIAEIAKTPAPEIT